jgi:hypothetical protein
MCAGPEETALKATWKKPEEQETALSQRKATPFSWEAELP